MASLYINPFPKKYSSEISFQNTPPFFLTLLAFTLRCPLLQSLLPAPSLSYCEWQMVSSGTLWNPGPHMLGQGWE